MAAFVAAPVAAAPSRCAGATARPAAWLSSRRPAGRPCSHSRRALYPHSHWSGAAAVRSTPVASAGAPPGGPAATAGAGGAGGAPLGGAGPLEGAELGAVPSGDSGLILPSAALSTPRLSLGGRTPGREEEFLSSIGSSKSQSVTTLEPESTERSFGTVLQELAAIQADGPRNVAILGTRHASYLHQQIIELLTYANVLVGNHVFTSGAAGTNYAVIKGALRAEKPDLLTVVLPQSMRRQPADSQTQVWRSCGLRMDAGGARGGGSVGCRVWRSASRCPVWCCASHVFEGLHFDFATGRWVLN